MKSRNKENVLPSDKNIIPDSFPSQSSARKPAPNVGTGLKSPFPPRPNLPKPMKKKLISDSRHANGVSGSSNTAVKVIVRMRPLKAQEGEAIVKMTSGDSLSMLGQRFTFDAVADEKSTQTDIFQLVGAPLVEKCLDGVNSSIFAYGKSGSGKTFTIWGPTNALSEESICSNEQGLTPRVFQRLFSRIDEEQKEHADKELMYQCSCSFLEIYNEQITDLLNPSERNLHIRECPNVGVYIQDLTKETICNMDDVTQIFKKGLTNRRTAATNINIQSSRSHSVFTCIVESRSKMDGLSCFKTSRMNLVDLAGAEKQEATGATGERQKEACNINRSLTHLGNLVNILAKVSQTGKKRHIPYRDSKLTYLLQESLGGNAELAIVCAVSPAQSCKSETVSTLRFAQRAKTIKTKAVVNEQTHEDVSKLQQVIRQLEDEVILMKANQNQGDARAEWNPRRSLNILKFSLHYPMILPHVSDDEDEEMEIVDEEMESVSEGKCCKELKEALQMAMEGQARILELYTKLQEKHSNLLRSRCCCQGTHKEA